MDSINFKDFPVMQDENVRKIMSITSKSKIRMTAHGETNTYCFLENPESDSYELHVVDAEDVVYEDVVYGLSCEGILDVISVLLGDYATGIINEVVYVKERTI